MVREGVVLGGRQDSDESEKTVDLSGKRGLGMNGVREGGEREGEKHIQQRAIVLRTQVLPHWSTAPSLPWDLIQLEDMPVQRQPRAFLPDPAVTASSASLLAHRSSHLP